MISLIILSVIFAILGVYVFIPARGVNGYIGAAIVVGGFFGVVFLTKLIILA